MTEDEKFLTEFFFLERKGLYSITQSLKDISVDINTQITEVREIFAEATEKVGEGRKASLRCLSRVYYLVAASYRSEEDFHALWKTARSKVSYKRRKKPLVLIIQGLLGVDGKQASKWSKVIRLGFLRRVSPDEFFDHINGLGGIEKAAREHGAIAKSSKSGSGGSDRGVDGVPERRAPRHEGEKVIEAQELRERKIHQEACVAGDREQPTIRGTDVAANDNSHPSVPAKACEIVRTPASGVEGSGWVALKKTMARAATRKKKIRKIIEISIRPNGKVDLKKIVTEEEIIERADYATLRAYVRQRALKMIVSPTTKARGPRSRGSARRKKRA